MGDQDEANIFKLNPSTLTDPDVAPEIWVDRYAKLHGIEYNYKTNSLRGQGEALEAGLFISMMRLSCYEHRLDGIKRMLSDAFLIWRREQTRLFLNRLRSELSYHAIKSDLVGAWVEAATGSRSELDIAVMKHFAWQVKRKLFGLPVENHLMVVAVGKSGGGKSVAIHKLLSPLSEVTALRDLTVFKDQFSRRAFTRSFVMFFDELARSEDTDMNALKNIVTSPTVDWRVLGSEATNSAPQNCTFIGCSNSPLRERIKDPTSTRRFWQLNCAEKLSWDSINSIDYMSLWRSIDENGPCPVLPHLNAIRAVQERDIQFKDRIEYWLSEACAPSEFHSESPTTVDLYMGFSEWCRAQNMIDFEGVQQFARGLPLRITQLGWSAHGKHSSRGTTWSLKSKLEEFPKKPMGIGTQGESEAVSENSEITKASGEKT